MTSLTLNVLYCPPGFAHAFYIGVYGCWVTRIKKASACFSSWILPSHAVTAGIFDGLFLMLLDTVFLYFPLIGDQEGWIFGHSLCLVTREATSSGVTLDRLL